MINVGALSAVPRDIVWRPEALEAAVLQADAIVMSQTATMSLADYMRMRRARARLPDGATTADYLEADQLTRLEALGARYRQNYADRGLVAVARDLLDDRLAYERGAGRGVLTTVRSMARKAKKSTVHVGDLDARHVDEAVAVPDDNQIACLSAAIRATEAGKDGMAQRGASWARQDVRAVMASPLEQAVDQCAMFADGDLRRNGRTQWSEALADALTAARTTLMVTPISVAAEAGGLLDQAAARGLEVSGPEWRISPATHEGG
ncbi:TraB/GumN family protein [Brevundimonas diminuta]|nr:TraB/GumN family protein [Brevundimonas diminuta]